MIIKSYRKITLITIVTMLGAIFFIIGSTFQASAISISYNSTLPVIQKGTYFPEPLVDTSKAINDTTPYLNVLDPRSPDYGKVVLPTREPTDIYSNRTINNSTNTININRETGLLSGPEHTGFGTMLDSTNIYGIYAGQEVHPDFSMPGYPPQLTMYAPAIKAPNGDPLESMIAYTDVDIYGSYSGWEYGTMKR